jgi:ABC-2 type transport system ATP-binding protein
MNADAAVRPETSGETAIHAAGLGKRYRSVGAVWRPALWALRDCSFELPAGRIAALVGPNGAGKTTLLGIISGLLRPTTGQVDRRGRVAFVAQEKPLYRDYTVAEMLAFGRHSNLTWDQPRAVRWLTRFEVRLDRRCKRLSTGQQAQVALAVALAARPDLLLLDEPLANLDPLARREVMGELLAEVAEAGTTVILATHIVTELTGIADHLLLLAAGELVLDGAVDDLLAAHVRRTGPADLAHPRSAEVIAAEPAGRHSSYLARLPTNEALVADPRWPIQPVTLEELVLGYLKRSTRPHHRGTAA